MTSRPSQLPGRLLTPGAGRRVILHAMHSATDWLAYAVWQDGVLLRSLSLSPDGGITEDIGAPLPFEAPFWAGEHPSPAAGNSPATYASARRDIDGAAQPSWDSPFCRSSPFIA
jgi:hypothetical protein